MKRAYLSFATASVAAFSLLASAANAAIFTDRASFDAAAGPTTTETFQSCPSGNPTFNGTLGAGTCAGLVTGVTFTTSQGYIAQPGQSTNPTTALGVNTPTGGIQNIALTNTATAFGADLFENFGGGSQGAATNFSINLLLNGSSIGIFTPLVQPNGGSFWGITSASAFNQIQISQPSGYAVIDNVSFNNGGAVPEPATWAMMILGMGTVGVMMRRRRTLVAALS